MMSVPTLWECQHCTFHNKAHNNKCRMCFHPRHASETQWVCQGLEGSQGCGAINSVDLPQCSQCCALKPYFPHLLTDEKVERDLVEAMKNTHLESDDQQPQPTTGVPGTLDSIPAGGGKRRPAGLTPQAGPWRTGDRGYAGTGYAGFTEGVLAVQTDDEVLEFPDQECRLVLVGKTGNGKSHTGNTILGLKRFYHCSKFESTTLECQRHNNVRFGIRLEVVDTPGLFDTEMPEEKVKMEIAKCLGIIAPGPHAIVLVIRIGVKFTEEELKAVEKLDEIFGVQLIRFLVVVFSHGDRLDRSQGDGEEAALKRMLETSPSKLKELISRVRDRYVVIDNTGDEAVRNEQVKKLLRMVGGLLRVNRGRPYTTAVLQLAEECMHRREVELRQQLGGGRGRQGNGQQHSAMNFQCRDIAREEVVQGSGPLLDEIKARIVPLLMPVLNMVTTILLRKLIDQASQPGQYCTIM